MDSSYNRLTFLDIFRTIGMTLFFQCISLLRSWTRRKQNSDSFMIGSPNKPLQVNCMKRRTGPQTGPRVLMKKLMKAMVVKSKGRMIQAPLRTSLLVGLEVERGSEPLKYFIVIACAVYAYLHPHLRLGHLILMEHLTIETCIVYSGPGNQRVGVGRFQNFAL